MKYQAKDWKTDKVLAEAMSEFEIKEAMEYERIADGDWYLVQIVTCRHCDNEAQERTDHYGISTGYWCHECYDSNNYPYRRDAYDPGNEMGTREDKHWDDLTSYNERFSGDDY